MKLEPWHPRNSCWKRDERANDRQQPSNKNRGCTITEKKPVRDFKLVTVQQNIASVLLHQRTSTVVANLISDDRAGIAPDRARRRGPKQIELPGIDQVSGERHDDFRWQRNAGGFNRHQRDHAEISAVRDHADDEFRQDSNDFFSHASGELELSVLSKGVAGQGHSVVALGDLHADGLGFGSSKVGRTQHGILSKNLAVNLGDEKIGAARVFPPYLSCLNRFHAHQHQDYTLPLNPANYR